MTEFVYERTFWNLVSTVFRIAREDEMSMWEVISSALIDHINRRQQELDSDKAHRLWLESHPEPEFTALEQ